MLIIILITIGFVDYAIFRTASKIINRQTQQYIEDILLQTSKNIEQRLKDISDIIFYLQIDPTIQKSMSNIFSEKFNEFEMSKMESDIRKVLYLNVLYNDEIKAADIVLKDKRISITKSSDKFSNKLVNEKRIFERKGAQVWFGINRDTHTLVMGAAINNLESQLPIGYIISYIDEEYIKNIYMDIELSSSGDIFIIDNQGRVISNKRDEILNEYLDENYLEKIIGGDKESGFFLYTENGEENYLAYNYIEEQNWYLVTRIPAAIYKQNKMLLRAIIFFSIIALLAFFFAVSFMSARILKSVKQLNTSIKDFGDGNFNTQCKITTNDEIGELGRTYNSMVDKINELIKKEYRQTLLKQHAELESLRMQINPHFFYNTLETINWMARINGIDEVVDVAKAMGDLMRLAISGPEFITMEAEVTSISSYIKILNHRFGDTLEFNINVEKELGNLYLPKLIIQPILENAFIHGIAEKHSKGKGKITISITLENNDLIKILVEDNGVGIIPEKLKSIQSQHDDEQSQNVDLGIHNVDRRLKLYFGNQYGVRIESIVNVGTKVMIEFPSSDSDSWQLSDFYDKKWLQR